METDSGFITSGGFSAPIRKPHFSNSEMDSSTKSFFFKADWLLWNEAHLGVLKKGILQPSSIISKFVELAESVSRQKIFLKPSFYRRVIITLFELKFLTGVIIT